MSNANPQRIAAIEAIIDAFLKRRHDQDLKGKKASIADLAIKYQKATWLSNAAKEVVQLQLVTHVLKATHPKLTKKIATSIYVRPESQSQLNVVGSHVLAGSFRDDVSGNSAALPIFDFLTEKFEGLTLHQLVRSNDIDLAAALSAIPAQSVEWMNAFSGIEIARNQKIKSHTLSKQMYWPIGDNPHNDTNYHVLSPLFASPLAHRLFETLKEDRFSEAAIEASKAKEENRFHQRPVRMYTQLGIQKLGGSNAQNISQLNVERLGNNALLASLPPLWRSVDVKPLLNTDSMFHSFGRLSKVRAGVTNLLRFLQSDPKPNAQTRNTRDALFDGLVDEFLQFSATLQALEPGWSQQVECRLGDAESRWLDPKGVALTDAELDRTAPTDVADRISASFANWLNAKLRDPLPMGDNEFDLWRNAIHKHIKAQERDGAYAD